MPVANGPSVIMDRLPSIFMKLFSQIYFRFVAAICAI